MTSPNASADDVTSLVTLLTEAGFPMTDCPVLLPSEGVLDLVGPLTRGRLFITTGVGGREYCLRPEFTIPIASRHVEAADRDQPARYGYCGPVFRKRPTGTGEFLQAGVESFGDNDEASADSALILLAWQVCKRFGNRPETLCGDQALFHAVVDVLHLPAIWRRRLRVAFGDQDRLNNALDALEHGGVGSISQSARLAGLGKLDPDTALAVVEEMIGATPTGKIAGRSAREITERLLEKTRATEAGDTAGRTSAVLRDYLSIDCPLEEAPDLLARFADTHKIDLSARLDVFVRRLDLIRKGEPDLSGIRFQSAFGRQLDYYTGFNFDVFGSQNSGQQVICGGGRYDGLAERLGADRQIPAVGFSLWLDRLLGGNVQ